MINPFFRYPLIAILSVLVTSCDNNAVQTKEEILRPVKVHVIGGPSHGTEREFPGVVDANQKAELGFRVAGKVEKLFAREADKVEKGQLLAKLDQRDYKIQFDSRSAEYEQAHSAYLRGKQLIKKNIISRADFDTLKAQDLTARANLDAAKNNLDYTELKAPFSGEVSRRHVEEFEDVTANQPVYSLQDVSALTVKVDVPEVVMINIKRDAKRQIFAIFDAIPGKQFPLTFKEASTQADEQTNTFQVTLAMQNIEDYQVLPGMSVTVRGKRTDEDTVPLLLTVPAHAILEDSQGRYVYLVGESADGVGIVSRQAVTTGKLTSSGLEVTSGLKQGDRVIAAGMSKMREGLKVRVDQ